MYDLSQVHERSLHVIWVSVLGVCKILATFWSSLEKSARGQIWA